MPVDTPQASYSLAAPLWKRCRDAIAGEDAVRLGRTDYVPQPRGMKKYPWLYDDYLKRAIWYGASGRTVLGLGGAICRRPPVVKLPSERLEDYLKNVTMRGTPFPTFAREMITEVLSVGRRGAS
jgi:hypothetical protein